MAILLNFWLSAPLQNYDITSRASNNAKFKKNFKHEFSHLNAPFCQGIAELEQVVFFWYNQVFSIRDYCIAFYQHAHTVFWIRTQIETVMFSLKELKNACVWTTGFLAMTLDGFSALLLVLPAFEKKKQERFYTTFCHLILRLELLHNAM